MEPFPSHSLTDVPLHHEFLAIPTQTNEHRLFYDPNQISNRSKDAKISGAMHLLYYSISFALPILAASSSDDSKHHNPCTIRSPTSGAFFDLNPVHVTLPEAGKKVPKDARNESWSARGYDYGANFTLNFCGPVIENLTDVVGVDDSRWANVSAFYKFEGKTYSIG